MDEDQERRIEDWVRALAAELNVPAPVESAVILDVAKDAAHSIARPAAPVTTYLQGYAVAQGVDPQEVARTVARLARDFDG